jgi:hypothetical protein
MNDLKSLLEIHIDYLSFVFPLSNLIDVKDSFNAIKEDLALLFYLTSNDYGQLNDWGQDGYKHQLSLGENITIRFGGQLTQMKFVSEDNSISYTDSCMVELKGQACREVEFLSGGNLDYLTIIDWVNTHGGRFTRIDIAIDDTTGNIITLDKVVDTVSKGLYTSSFRSDPEIISSALNKVNLKEIKDLKGTSLYFGKSNGKRKNNLELCIYDKAAERRFNNDSYVGNYWVRYEMRFRKEQADALAFYLQASEFNDLGEFACSQLKRILTLKQQTKNNKITNDINVSRLDILEDWDTFLNVLKGSKFSLKPVKESTIDRKLAWRSYSLTRQNILLDLADAYDEESYVEFGYGKLYSEYKEKLNYLKENRNKITEKDIHMINNYKRSKGKFNALVDENTIDEYIKKLEEIIKEIEKRYILPF